MPINKRLAIFYFEKRKKYDLNSLLVKTYHIEAIIIAQGKFFPRRTSRKGEIVNPTKEQLILWRQQGRTNREIARMTGKSLGTINGLFSKYKIPRRDTSVPKKKIEIMVQMKKSGSSIREIAESTGYSELTIRNHIKAAGLMPEKQPEGFSIAEPREPHIFRTVISGKKYIDVTELYIPT